MMNVGGEEKPVTVYFNYGNMPDSLDYSVGTTWSSESAGGQQYTPINSWDTSVFSNAKFYDDGESYSAEDLLINAKPMN